MDKLLCFSLGLLVFFSLYSVAIACQFDTDCQPGNKCLKPAGSIYGVCTGGISPGNQNDKQPVYSSLDPNGTYGDTCSTVRSKLV